MTDHRIAQAERELSRLVDELRHHAKTEHAHGDRFTADRLDRYANLADSTRRYVAAIGSREQ